MEQKKVLVVGACGGMGGAVCASLLQNGYTVFGLDRAACCATEGVRYIKSDVTEESSLRAALAYVRAEAEQFMRLSIWRAFILWIRFWKLTKRGCSVFLM